MTLLGDITDAVLDVAVVAADVVSIDGGGGGGGGEINPCDPVVVLAEKLDSFVVNERLAGRCINTLLGAFFTKGLIECASTCECL